MTFYDTQIISYKFKKNDELFNGNIKGGMISSIVAEEFLGVMGKNNKAKVYFARLSGAVDFSTGNMKLEHRKPGYEIGKNKADKLVIDFNGEFDSIQIYSNNALSYYINRKELDPILFFAINTLDKDDYKKFKERAEFLIENDLTVVPVTQDIVTRMQELYQDIKNEYNLKDNYKNSFMDLLIISTALVNKTELVSMDKELNKVLKKYSNSIIIDDLTKGIVRIREKEIEEEKRIRTDSKGYINKSWRLIQSRGNDIVL